MAWSALFYSVMSTLVKMAGEEMASQQIVLARAAIALVLSWWAIRRLGISPWGRTRHKLLVLRGVLGFAGLTCFFYAVTHLPLADATVIMYMNPVFVGLFAALFLGEAFGRAELLGVGVSLCGVALITQPSFLFGGDVSRLDPLAVGVAILGAVIAASAYTIVRALKEDEHPMVVVFYFPLIATPLAIPTAWPVLTWPSWTGWLLLLGVGVATQIAQVLMTNGLHREKAARATSVSYLQIVFAFIIGMIFFDETPGPLAIAGSILIVGSSLGVALARRTSSHEGESAPEPAE